MLIALALPCHSHTFSFSFPDVLNIPQLWAMMIPHRGTVSFLSLVELIDRLTLCLAASTIGCSISTATCKVCFLVVFMLQMMETAWESLKDCLGSSNKWEICNPRVIFETKSICNPGWHHSCRDPSIHASQVQSPGRQPPP